MSTMTDAWHGCRILVHLYCCCVYGRYWNNVFDHSTSGSYQCAQPTHWRACCSSDPLRTRTSRSKPQHHVLAAPGFFLEPDSLQLESHVSCERALLNWCSFSSHRLLHSLRLIEQLLVQLVHCCRLVSHFDNLLNSSLLYSVISHVDNLFSSSLLNTLYYVVFWSTDCGAAELLLLPLLWGLCRLFHICL